MRRSNGRNLRGEEASWIFMPNQFSYTCTQVKFTGCARKIRTKGRKSENIWLGRPRHTLTVDEQELVEEREEHQARFCKTEEE